MTDQLIGRRLGSYEVRALLGSGGMGRVYRGYDAALERDCAIKVIGTRNLLPDYIERFRREARLAAALRHPNIVQVYSFGEQDDLLYMVQELLPGQTLAQQLARMGKRRLAAGTIHRILKQLGDALDYAHAQGVVHRDVKPGNAIYNADNLLVLTDFGLARDNSGNQTDTGPGVVMGTPAYIAPEQAVSSKGISKASDIYALGVVAYELVTSRLPFEAETPMAVVLKHLYEEAEQPSKINSNLPKELDAVIMRAMHKEPSQRYSSAGTFVRAFAEAWPTTRSVSSGTRSSKARPASAPLSRAVGESSSPSATPKRSTPARNSSSAASRSKSGTTPSAGNTPVRTPSKTPSKPASSGTAARVAATPSVKSVEAGSQAASSTKVTKPAQNVSEPKTAPKASPALETGPKKRSKRLLVALLTLCCIGIALLFGFGFDLVSIERGWFRLQSIVIELVNSF
jgi:serine/threonine protein kinase